MTQETKILLGIGLSTVLIIVGAAFFLGKPMPQGQNSNTKADQKLVLGQDAQSKGQANAKITLVEFGDYQCPACGAAHFVVKDILTTYGKDVKFVFRNFPLSRHKNAVPGATAAEAAAKFNKFWEMHDKLYESQQEWSESKDPKSIFVGYAKTLGIDEEAFEKAMDDNGIASKIQKDQSDGDTLGVNSTPTFYINNEKIDNFNTLKAEVEKRLKK
jgi:protein-disulfide isomerase